MSLNSVNTNISAQVALQSLNTTSSELQATQKRISTGYRVADASDDGAAYAVAQRVRADVGALTSVNDQLGSAKGLVSTSMNALSKISDSVNQAQKLLVQIGSNTTTTDQRAQYVSSYQKIVSQVADYVDNSKYNGQSLLGSVTGGASAPLDKTVIGSETGSTKTLNKEDMSTLANDLAGLIGSTFARSATGTDTFATATDAAAQTAAGLALSATTGSTAFSTSLKSVANANNQIGSDSNMLDATISFNSSKIDSLNAGLGALIDTDLSKESAKLQALQIKQQLGTQALSMANQAPQSLMSLFK